MEILHSRSSEDLRGNCMVEFMLSEVVDQYPDATVHELLIANIPWVSTSTRCCDAAAARRLHAEFP